MKFQYELQRLRKQAGMSQEELGERLGVSRQTISKWDNGTSYPDMLNLMTISGFFSVSVDSLVTDAPAPPQPADEAQVQKNGQGTARFHYEYKSKRTVFGMPLVHVNIGSGLYKAKGFVAVGMISKGIISIGVVSLGLVSFGAVALGLFAMAAISLGLFAMGGVAAGIVAIAGTAAGVFALGGVAAGVSSVGGVAAGTHIAVGGWCSAPVAIGVLPNGIETIQVPDPGDIINVTKAQAYDLIGRVFPDIWRPLADWAVMAFR